MSVLRTYADGFRMGEEAAWKARQATNVHAPRAPSQDGLSEYQRGFYDGFAPRSQTWAGVRPVSEHQLAHQRDMQQAGFPRRLRLA